MSHFGENLKRMRERKNMCGKDLALKARLGTGTIQKYESNEANSR